MTTIEVRTRDGSNQTCEVVELTPEQMSALAEELDALQAVENDGRGIRHVHAIATYLSRGEYDIAFGIYQTDGDKTNMYPRVKNFLSDRMGCRLHGVRNCPSWICDG